MDSTQTYELGQRFADALRGLERGEEGALERIVGLFSPEANLTNSALKLSGDERQGAAGVRFFWEQYRSSLRDVETEFFEVTSSDRAAGLFWTTRGRDSQGGPVEYDGVSLLVFDEDGAISMFRGYYDTRELTRQVSG